MMTFSTIDQAQEAGWQRAEAGLIEAYRGGEIFLRSETPPPAFGASIVLRASRQSRESQPLCFSSALRVDDRFIAVLSSDALEKAVQEGRVWIDAEIERESALRPSEELVPVQGRRPRQSMANRL